MEPVSVDTILNNIAFYDRKNQLLSIVDIAANSTVAHYENLQISENIQMEQCWAYVTSRKRSNDSNQSSNAETIHKTLKNVSAQFFVCVIDHKICPKKFPSIQINNIKNKNSYEMELSNLPSSRKNSNSQLTINALAVHPFDNILFTGLNDGSIFRWSLGDKKLTKLDYTCSSSVIALAIQASNSTLIFIEEKSSTIHIASIDKSLKSLFVLNNECNHSSISMRIVNSRLFGLCDNKSKIMFLKATGEETEDNFNFTKFHSIHLKNNVSDFDIVEYNNFYYCGVLHQKMNVLSIFALQNIYNFNPKKNDENSSPLYSITITSDNKNIRIIKIKLVANAANNMSPIILVYYLLEHDSGLSASKINAKISIVYLDDLKLGANTTKIGSLMDDIDKLEPTLNQVASLFKETSTHKLQSFDISQPSVYSEAGYTTSSLPTTKTLVQTLTQVINSNDNRLLEEIISRTSTSTIDNSIQLLSSPLAYRLLCLLTSKIEANASKTSELSCWIKSILSNHVSFFSTVKFTLQIFAILSNTNEENGLNPIQKLQDILEFRSHFYGQLSEIQGRLSVLINHVIPIKLQTPFDKQYELEHKLVQPVIKIDENFLEDNSLDRLTDVDSNDNYDELSEDLEEMETSFGS